MKRRDFISKGCAACGLILAGSPFLAACSGIRRIESTRGLPVKPYPGIKQPLADILSYASLAPSGHNAQPWYVRVTGPREFIIGLDQKRRLPVADPDNREALISLGAFIENLCLASASYGLSAEVKPIAAGPLDEDVAVVTLEKTAPARYPLEKITMRRTVRKGLKQQELLRETLSGITGHMKEHAHYFPQESAHGKCLAECAVEAFREQTYQDDAQKELSRWVRFSSREAEEHLDGLTVESMEIQGLAGWYVRTFMDSKDVMKDSFRSRGIDMTADYARQGAGWLVITGKGNSPADLIETGRAFERFFLEARERMIAVHPMNQILEVKKQKKDLSARHESSFIPHLILRIGYLDSYPDPVSPRRPVSSFIRT